MKKLAETLGSICMVAITIALSVLVQGYVLCELWKWFIVPLGVPPISIIQAFGLAVTARLIVVTL
jgi:hypothetical protein